MPDSEIYGLVVNGEIQYPITTEDINQINVSTNNYLRCYFTDKKPINPIIEYYVDIPNLIGQSIIVDYEVKTKTIEELFAELDIIYGQTVIDINTVDPALLDGFNKVLTIKVQDRLDTFAKTKGYDDIKSAVTYLGSAVTNFANEASVARALRDQTWDVLYGFLNDMMSQVAPVPRSWPEIELILPELAWV